MKTPSPLTVLMDTSFILAMLKDHRNFHEEIRNVLAGHVRVATTDGVIMELRRLSRGGSFETAGLAKVALETFEKGGVDILEASPEIPDVDSSIVAAALADKGAAAVATVDRRLRDALLKHGLTAIFPRGHQGLMVLQGSHPVPLK